MYGSLHSICRHISVVQMASTRKQNVNGLAKYHAGNRRRTPLEVSMRKAFAIVKKYANQAGQCIAACQRHLSVC